MGIIKGSTMHSRDIKRKAKVDHLDQVHSDQMVLEMIRRGRLVLFIVGQESQKNNSKRTFRPEFTQIRWLVRRKAGPCEWRPTQGLGYIL